MSKVTLLVMDDDPAMNRIIQEVIGYLGYDVRITPNAEDGFALAEKIRPDLVLVSARMPGMEARRICQWLRTQPATAETPILLLSHRPSGADFEEESAMGARYCAVRPFLANDFAADLYHLCKANFRLPQNEQELLRVTRILPEPPPVEAAPAPPAEAAPAPAPVNANSNGNGGGNGRQHVPEEVETAEGGNDAELQPGRRHLRRFAQREAETSDLEELAGELRVMRQMSLANSYRIKAVVAALEEAGLVQRGAVDRLMQQVMREAHSNGS